MDFKPGELVDFVIRGARVMDPKPGHDDTLTLGYAQTSPGIWHTITIDTRHAAGKVDVTRVAPAEWPPQFGDLWRDDENLLWFYRAAEHGSDRVSMSYEFVPADNRRIDRWKTYRADTLLTERGPLTLVHREHRDQADAGL